MNHLTFKQKYKSIYLFLLADRWRLKLGWALLSWWSLITITIITSFDPTILSPHMLRSDFEALDCLNLLTFLLSFLFFPTQISWWVSWGLQHCMLFLSHVLPLHGCLVRAGASLDGLASMASWDFWSCSFSGLCLWSFVSYLPLLCTLLLLLVIELLLKRCSSLHFSLYSHPFYIKYFIFVHSGYSMALEMILAS